jgi:uncharacterized protein (DUF1810 family)
MDAFNLERFVRAQGSGVYEAALAELGRGRKDSHWMWFIFPQVEGLGRSQISRFFAIESLDEARAFLDHPVLGARLLEATSVLLTIHAPSAKSIFGSIDAQKLQSSMTLFMRTVERFPPAGTRSVFSDVLDAYFAGTADAATDEQLARWGTS